MPAPAGPDSPSVVSRAYAYYVLDRGSRRAVVTFSVVLWSAMTAVSGLARSFWQLALARIGVGTRPG